MEFCHKTDEMLQGASKLQYKLGEIYIEPRLPSNLLLNLLL